MNQNYLAIAEEPVSYSYLSNPVVVPEYNLNDGSIDYPIDEAISAPFYQLSEDFTTEVTFYNASENQTITATVKLNVSLTLHLDADDNETIWSGICYSGTWKYATNVSIEWANDCPWDLTEKERQCKLVEDSVYVTSLNINCKNSKGTKSICHYEKNNRTFMVEFAEGQNTLNGSIVIASDYLPKYTIEVDTVENTADGSSGITTAEASATSKIIAQKKQSQYEITGVSIDTKTIKPNQYNFIYCSATITVDVPITEEGDNYTISFTLSAAKDSKKISDNFTVKIIDGKVKLSLYNSSPFQYSFTYDQTKVEITVSTSKLGESSFKTKLYQSGSQNYTLKVLLNEKDKIAKQPIEVSEYSGVCWANSFLKAFGLDINSDNLGRLIYNLYDDKGNYKVRGDELEALKLAGFNPQKECELSIDTIIKKLQNNIVFLDKTYYHTTFVKGYKIKDGKVFFDVYDTSNENGHEQEYEASELLKSIWLNGTLYDYIIYVPKSCTLNQKQFEAKFKLKTELLIETKRNAPADHLLGNMLRTGHVYSHTFTDSDYSDLYISNLNVAFGENATLSNAWLREGTTVGVMEGATISDSWVLDDSSLYMYSGAELSGTLTISGQLIVEGPITINDVEIELDISSLDGAGDNAVLINGIDYLEGASWSIRIAENQNAGTYLLADNASSFNSGVNIDYSGNVNVGETLTIGLANYTLNLSAAGELSLTIAYDEPEDGIAPTTPNVTEVLSASGNVTLNWEPSTDLNGISQYVLYYSLNESFWESDFICTTDTSATISGVQDGVYYMRVCAFDTYGNVSEYSETQIVQVGPPEISVSINDSNIFLNRYLSEQQNYIFTSEIRNDSDIDIDDLYVKVMISEDEFYGSDDYMLAGLTLGQLKAGESVAALLKFNIPEQYLTGDYHIGIVASDYTDDYQFQVEDWISFNGEDELEYYGTDVLLPNVMPQAEYMYGCTPTALGMLLGYYDLYGYNDKDFSNLIEGDIDIYSRGTDGSMYNMNAFDTVLGNFIASEDYVYRFFSREDLSVITGVGCSNSYRETTPTEELPYSFVNGGTTFDTSVWNCLADYIGTGQYWRGQDNLSTALSYSTLEDIINSTSTRTFTGDGYTRTIDYKYTTLLYGLYLYVQSRGYELNTESTGTYATDTNGGDFTFEDYMREIDAGRPVLISITDHSMVGYGYNAKTKEIIFDDDYAADQRMVWGESYYYSNKNRDLQSITVLAFRTQPGNRDLTFDGTVQLANQASANDSSIFFFEGDSVYLSFNAKNEGSDPCYSFKIDVKVDGVSYDVLDITKLDGNEVRQFRDLRLDGLTAGTHKVEVILDSNDTVEETTSNNNRYSQTIQVLPEGMQILSSRTTVSSGQTASNTLVIATGSTTIGSMTLDGGYAENIYLQGFVDNDGYGYLGILNVKNGGIAKHIEAFDLGRIYVSSGGNVSNAILHSGGVAGVYSGGSVSGLSVESSGGVVISGGSASGLSVEPGGYVDIVGGAVADATFDGSLYFYGSNGGMLSSATINEFFSMQATGGAMATDIILGSKARAYIYSGGTLQNVSGKGYAYVANNGIIRNAEILGGGTIVAANDGRTEDVILNNRTSQKVYSGGTAIRTSALGGWLNVSSGGVVSSAIIGSGASMSLREGAKAYNLTVEQGGIAYSWPLGYLYGNLTIGGRVQDISGEGIAGVSSYLFNVQAQMDDAFLSLQSGGIAANASITIDVSNAWGDYTLVKGDLSSLSSATITVKSSSYTSSISANGSATLGDGRKVQLTKGTDAWSLNVSGTDNTPPQTPSDLTSQLIDNTLQLSWQAVQDFSGVKYEVEYSRNADFTNSMSKIATASSMEILLANGHWHWRLRSVDGAGNTSPWTNGNEIDVDYTKVLKGTMAQTQSAYSDVMLSKGTSINASYPGGLQLMGDDFNVTLLGNDTITCASIRNAAILFGEDASWGDYYDGTVTFAGTNITLHSEVSNCITAAGIRGNNLTVNFTEAASGAESIVFEATNGLSGPGNYAAGVQAAENLTVNGDFGGTISCVMDCRKLTSTRWGYMEGFYALGNVEFNGDMDGTIYLAGYGTDGSYAYGLYSYQNLTVNGDIGGVIMATAENNAYGLYGYSSLTASISGIVFAGTTTEDNDLDTLKEKLNNFNENSTELLGLAKGNYSVCTYGEANLTLTDEALLIGDIRVGSNSQISISSGASIYGDFTAYGSTALQFVLDDTSLAGTRWTMSKWSSYLSMSVNADDVSSDGAYSLVSAKDLSSVSGITMTVDGQTLNLKTSNSVNVNGVTYSLANQKTSSQHTLVLTVSGSAMKDREVPVLNGQIQVQQGVGRNATLTWQAATDNVGVKGYELKWDGQVRTVEQTSCALENITAGTHTCQIRAFDEAGNYSDWSAEQNVVFVDSAAPVLVSIAATPSEPTNQDVSIFVEYEDDFGICNVQYRFGDDDWRAYDSQVLVTSNAIVSFRALDETGNVSDVTQFQVSNIDKEAPEAPTATASTTLPTNQDVIVTATFSEDTEQRQYSLDGQKWSAYTDGVAMSGNGTIYFRGIDAADNVSDVTSCTVSNIDKVTPAVSNLYVSEPDAEGIVTIALTASEPLSQLKYSWNGGDWVDFPGDELNVSESGTVRFLLVDSVGNETITEGYFVSTIIPTADDWTDLATNGPDSDEIGNFGVAEIGASFIEEIGKDDKIDYMAIELNSAASLSFTVSSVNAAKFTLYQLQSKVSKGVTTYSLKSLQNTTLKANIAVTTKNQLLEAGIYYIGMAANDKKSADELYTIAVSDKSVFFTNGDNSDDWTEMKTRGADGLAATLGTVTAESGTLVEDGWVGYGDAIDYAAFTLDSAASLAFDLNATDAAKFTIYQLQSKVNKNVTTYSLKSLQSTTLKANVAATTKNLLLEKGTYYVAMEGTNAKKGGSADYTVALGAKSRFYPVGDDTDDWGDMKTAGAAGAVGDLGTVTAESGMLCEDGWVGFGDAFDYAAFTLDSAASLAFDLTSTDAAKFTVYQLQSKESKGVTTYSLKSLQSTTLKANVNATTKNILLEKGTYYVAMECTNAKKGGYADYTLAASAKSAFFTEGNNEDDAWNAAELPVFGGEWEDWTGYGDAIDYRKLEMAAPGRLTLDLTATDAAKFTVWQLDAKTNRLKSVQATTLKANKDKTQYTASTKELLLNGGTYYISMECTTAKKGGSADFTVVYGDRYELFENCDNSNDTWKAVASNDAAAIGDVLNGWVGFGDTADFYKFEVAEAGKLSLTFDEETEAAVKAKQLKLSCLDAKGKAVSLAAFKDGSVASSKALAAGEYYLGITCANVQKYDTSYNVSLGMLA